MMNTKNYKSVPYSGYGGQGLQVFTPNRIESIAPSGTLDTTGITAIRVPAEVSYQLNGTGTIALMPAGCTGIAKDVDSLVFVDAVVVEVM